MTNSEKRFKAKLEKDPKGLGWTIARVPKWEVPGRARIRGEINGFAFRSSLFASTEGWRFILVNKQMQTAAGVRLGELAEFRIEADEEERRATVPKELQALFRQEKALRAFFEELNLSARRDVCRWISEPKSAGSRQRRAEQFAERCLSTIEAERELPPMLRTAFVQNAKAARGWNRMTPVQRRSHLLGIFGYKTPESRSRRLQKALEDAERVAEKHLD